MHSKTSLDDKYTVDSGTVFISGTQALVRLCIKQRAQDKKGGLNTSGFVSGYRGSPLGSLDSALWQAKDHLVAHNIIFRPGVNEDIAATSCWGTQQAGFFPGPKYDGVFAVWYGKGPGVDRSGDALKHGNLAGTSVNGGVLIIAGDDHGAKSSTTAHQSEQALIAAMIPVFYPATVQEYLDLGAYMITLSRFAGLWVGFKCITEIIETSATVEVKEHNVRLPSVIRPERGVNISLGFNPLAEEASLINYRLPAAQAFVAENGLDRVQLDAESRTLGIITAGKAYTDTLQALDDLGLNEERARELGIRLYKLAMIWPIEPSGLQKFAAGHQEVFVVEEKRSMIEDQVATLLYNTPGPVRPRLTGKYNGNGVPLLPSDGELNPQMIADALVRRLEALGLVDESLLARAQTLQIGLKELSQPKVPTIRRSPAFCSGCPHNTSTKLPEGSLALAGIGCHTMALLLNDRPTMPPTQMGAEGANWIGVAPFTNTQHVFQNLGDGTYFHSGLLAIRALVASGANITYKILYNDAVAMTGGQPVDGSLTAMDIVAQVRAEGIEDIVIVTDEPQKYRNVINPPPVYHRDELITIEKRLRKVLGVSILVYDQVCAAEKRRRRKRNKYTAQSKRYFINDLVCEGCADCSVQSNCISLQPQETEFGRKRKIDQTSCNMDYSCIKGFCPSFVTVLGGRLRKHGSGLEIKALEEALMKLELPNLPALDQPYSILLAGIGGTGVVTIGSMLGMAAKLDGLTCSVLNITGLSQKNGAVFSHLKLAEAGTQLHSARIGFGQSDLILGCDLVVAGSPDALATLKANRSIAVVNSHMTPTADFQKFPDMNFDQDGFQQVLVARLGSVERIDFIDATHIAERVFGDNIAANMFLTGYAVQKGYIPISVGSILEAITLNGIAVDMNRQVFQLGRHAAVSDKDCFQKLAGIEEKPVDLYQNDDLDAFVDRRAVFLTDYQNADYATGYKAFVTEVQMAEKAASFEGFKLTKAVARCFFKLMAYKDEYEVARLFIDKKFWQKLDDEFEGDYKVEFNFAPPFISGRDQATGHIKKRSFGPASKIILKALSWARFLRGSHLDIFGYTAERRQERQLIKVYQATIRQVLTTITTDTYDTAVKLAELPDQIRGYGHVKSRNVKIAEKLRQEYLRILMTSHVVSSPESSVRQ